jgi:hypothetical protein
VLDRLAVRGVAVGAKFAALICVQQGQTLLVVGEGSA